jgi:uncharacterized membrane protein YdjX (TVP38/TMEM64 family)
MIFETGGIILKDSKSKLREVLLKSVQIVPVVFTAVMVVLCIAFIVKNDISLTKLDNLAVYFSGSTLTIALMLIGFHIIKSFALVISPVLLYTLAGILFDDFRVAMTVNIVGTVLSLVLPYYLGRFMGAEAVESLKKRFKVIEKFDSFTGENAFGVVFISKVACLLPSDLNSLVLGAMNLPFGKYFAASNAGLLLISILWTLFGASGDFTNIYSYLYLLPIVFITLGGVLYLSGSAEKNKDKN